MIDRLSGNVFYEHRKDIQKIAREKRVDAGIATMMFVEDNKEELGNYGNDYREWLDIMAEYSASPDRYISELFE